MAKRAGGGSQRQNASPTKLRSTAPATTRTTRAQSRELSEPMATPRKRKTRANSAGNDGERRAKRAGRSKIVNEVLETVQENPDRDDGDTIVSAPRRSTLSLREDSSVEPLIEEVSSDEEPTPSDDGTTASAEEAKEIDADGIPRCLEILDSAVVKAAAIILAGNAYLDKQNWKALMNRDSQQFRQLKREIRLIDLQKEELSTHCYIRPSVVHKAVLSARKTLHEDDAVSISKIDPIICRANLVKMIHDLFVSSQDASMQEQTLRCLSEAQERFPELIARNGNLQAAIDLNYQLSVQMTIAKLDSARLSSDVETDIRQILEEFFQDDDEDTSAILYLQRYREVDGFAQDQVSTYENSIRTEMAHLKELVSNVDIGQIQTELVARYPWEEFESDFLRYARTRHTELSHYLASIGGMRVVVQQIEDLMSNITRTNRQDMLHAKLVNGSEHTAPARSATAVLRRKARAAQQQPGLQRAAPVASMLSVLPGNNTSAIDPVLQSDAVRYSDIISSRQSQTSIRPRSIATPKKAALSSTDARQRVSVGRKLYDDTGEPDEFEEIQPTQDHGFQDQPRSATKADQRRQQLRVLQQEIEQARAARRRSEHPVPFASHASSSTGLPQRTGFFTTPEGLAAQIEASQPAPDIEPTSSIMERMQAAVIKANRAKAVNRPVRVKRAWTVAETDRLDLLIRCQPELPLSYSALLEADRILKMPDSDGNMVSDSLLQHRRPEDLRFKARNVKTKCMRAGQILPARWDQVVLAEAQIRELEQYGVRYDRSSHLRRVPDADEDELEDEIEEEE